MKKINVFILVSITLFMSLESYSQIVIVKGGLDFPDVIVKDIDGKMDTKMITGFQVGAFLEFPVNDKFSFETGLQFLRKGTKQTYTYGGYSTEGKLETTYLDIPFTAKARFDFKGVKLYGVFGPYLGFGLGGQIYDGGEGTTVKWGSDVENDDLKRADFGLEIGGGVEINAFQVGLTYELGLANISTYTGDGTKMSNRVLAISVGYMFGNH